MSNRWDVLMESARQFIADGKLALGEGEIREALEEAKQFDKTDFRLCSTYLKLAEVQLLMGKKMEAITVLETALKLRISALGPHHVSVVTAKMDLARVCFEAKLYSQAEDYATDGLKLYELTYGSDTGFAGAALLNLATMYHVQKRYDEAENAYKRSLSIRMKVLGAEHPDTGAVLRNYARLMKETHREAEAKHLDSCATGVITGSWKPIQFEESESLHADTH